MVVSLKIVTEVASIKKNKPVLIVRHGIRAYWFLEKLRVQHINGKRAKLYQILFPGIVKTKTYAMVYTCTTMTCQCNDWHTCTYQLTFWICTLCRTPGILGLCLQFCSDCESILFKFVDSIIPVAGRSVKVWMHGIKNILARGIYKRVILLCILIY